MQNKFRLEKKAFDLIEIYWDTKYVGEFIRDVDGFYMYFPTKLGDKEPVVGGFTEWFLREIADLLTKVNKEWQDYINEHFKYPNKIFSEQSEFKFINNYEISRNTNNQ
jgi:hypothetical protein